jgi:hypothetical protein
VWSALSKAYAENAEGKVHVFQEKIGVIWKNYEEPTLKKKGVEYEVHDVKSVTNIKKFVDEIIKENN